MVGKESQEATETQMARKAREKEMPDNTRLELGSTGIDRGTNILDLEVPPQLERRVPTGIDWLDDLFGSGEEERGVTPSTSVLLTGTPGAGKSTLCLQLADSWTRQGGTCLYNTSEESLLQVRKVAKRLGLKDGFVCGEERLVPKVLEHADYLREQNPNSDLLLIFDSLQTHDDGFYSNGGTNSMTPVRVMKQVTSYCKTNYAVAICIGQVTKSGAFAGKQQIKHDADVHAHLSMDAVPTSSTFGKRVFRIEKNRFGLAMCGFYLGIDGKRGLYVDGEWTPIVEED